MKSLLGKSLWLTIFCLLGSSPVFSANQALFNGENLEGWVSTKTLRPAAWKVTDGYVEVVPGLGDIQTEAVFNDFDLHAEFWIPYLPEKHGQDRGNSGIFLQGRYEVQILDSWDNETYADGVCGALYKILAPKVKAHLPPENWQTYDIHFLSPRVDAQGRVVEKGEVTIVLNGTVIIDRGNFDRPTGSAGKMKQGVPGPIRLQDHGSAVRFRNIRISSF